MRYSVQIFSNCSLYSIGRIFGFWISFKIVRYFFIARAMRFFIFFTCYQNGYVIYERTSHAAHVCRTPLISTDRCRQVDRHEGVAGDEEVVEPDDVLQIVQHVAVPRD